MDPKFFFTSPEPDDLTMALLEAADDSISDEQVQRVLAPVYQKIYAGEFDRHHNNLQRPWHHNGVMRQVIATTSIAAVIIIATVALLAAITSANYGNASDNGHFVTEIPDSSTPLASEAPTAYVVEGYISSLDITDEAFLLNLIDTKSMEPAHIVPLGFGGFYRIEGMIDGEYLVVVTQSDDKSANKVQTAWIWTLENGALQRDDF